MVASGTKDDDEPGNDQKVGDKVADGEITQPAHPSQADEQRYLCGDQDPRGDCGCHSLEGRLERGHVTRVGLDGSSGRRAAGRCATVIQVRRAIRVCSVGGVGAVCAVGPKHSRGSLYVGGDED